MATLMNRETFLDKGERVFVFTVSFVLAMEVVSTLTASGTAFSLARLILGVFGSIFILYLAQRLYAGDRSIENVALAWAGFQIVLLVASLALGSEPRTGVAGMIQDIGVPGRIMAALKLIAYLSFAAGLVMRSSARAFLAYRRGEQVDHYLPETVADVSAPLSWTADQAQILGSLSKLMLAAGILLILLGAYVILYAIPPSLNISVGRGIAIFEGAMILGRGGLLLMPARALAGAGEAALATTGSLHAALRHLTYWHLAVGVIGALLLVTLVVRFLLDRA